MVLICHEWNEKNLMPSFACLGLFLQVAISAKTTKCMLCVIDTILHVTYKEIPTQVKTCTDQKLFNLYIFLAVRIALY